MKAHPSAVRPGLLVPWVPGARIRCMASVSKVMARSDSSSSQAAEPVRHKAGSSREERLICRRLPDELASCAERLGARLYPEPVRAGIGAQAVAGGWGPLTFQESEDAAYGLAAGGRA